MEEIKTIKQIEKWCSSATYVGKNNDLKIYNRGFEDGIAFAKEVILDIIKENRDKQ